MHKTKYFRVNALCGVLFLLTHVTLSQPLIEAVKRHDIEKVRSILSSPVDINHQGAEGATALLVAVRTWDAAICKELLDHGADPNAKGSSGITPLMEASIRGSYTIVDYLLKKGADANLCARLAEAADGQSLSNPGLVLTSPSARIEGAEKSPLILAAEGGNISVARLLLDHGADVNKQAEWFVTTSEAHYSVKGRTALMCAVQNRFPGFVKLLLEKKADADIQEWAAAGSRVPEGSESIGAPRPMQQQLFVKHSTALHIAAERSDRASAELLLAAGAGRDIRDGTNATPLIAALKNGATPVAELLIEKGADVNAEKNTPSSPLVLAASRGKLRLVDLLIKAGASPDQKAGEKGLPMISWAVMGGNRQVVLTLLERGADVNAAASDNSTPLMIAAHEGEGNIARLLIKWKARVNAKNNKGQTALIIASLEGRGDCIQALLASGADDTIRDKAGKTALAHAMEEGDQRIVRLLMKGRVASTGGRPAANERLSDVIEYFSKQIDDHYYSESQYLAFSKPYGKWDVRPLHAGSLPHPEGDGTIGPAQVPAFVWEVVAHHDFNLPPGTAQGIRSKFEREGFDNKERYCRNFYPSRRAAFRALCLQASQSPRSIFVQQRELASGNAYERVDNMYRQNRTYWRYVVPPGSPFQLSPRVDTVRGYQYTTSDESILQGLSGTGCYCMAKVNGYVVFMTGGVLESSIGFLYGKTRPTRGSLGPLFNLALVEDLGEGFYFYVSQ